MNYTDLIEKLSNSPEPDARLEYLRSFEDEDVLNMEERVLFVCGTTLKDRILEICGARALANLFECRRCTDKSDDGVAWKYSGLSHQWVDYAKALLAILEGGSK